MGVFLPFHNLIVWTLRFFNPFVLRKTDPQPGQYFLDQVELNGF